MGTVEAAAPGRAGDRLSGASSTYKGLEAATQGAVQFGWSTGCI